MTKQSRDDLMQPLNGITYLASPPENEGEARSEWTHWLGLLDITSHDYPYISSLLQSAYDDWYDEMQAHPAAYRAVWFTADHRGELLDRRQGQPQNEQAAALKAVRDCLVRRDWVVSKTEGGYSIAVPVWTRRTRELIAVLGCSIANLTEDGIAGARAWTEMSALHFRTCFYKRFEDIFVTDMLRVNKQAKREEHRRRILFQVVQKLHTQIDVDSVLTEVFERIAGMYPAATVELLMSQDHLSRDPRVKSLQLQGDRDPMCVSAFMEGRMLRAEKRGADGECLEIAAPLVGKQGVYGVFHLLIPLGEIDEVDLQLIGMLADTAGSAFENAKLYEQSNLLVSELRLINELAQRLNQSLRPKEVFKFATDELLSIFKAEYCCISQIDKDGDFFEITASNVPSLSKENFPRDYGFSGLVFATREPIILSDYKAYGKITSRLMEDTGARSLIVAPLVVRGEVIGAIMLAHREERFFSYDNYKLLQVLSSHIGLAIANASLHAEVRRMANHDMLTELYARHYLDDRIQEHQKLDEGGSLIIVDIDLFKQVNDTYGHQAGDKILKQVCSIIKSTIRKTDIAARWGGEELAVYLPGADAKCGQQIAESIRYRVAMETEPQVTVSCGIAEWTRDGSEKISVESLFYLADMALYKAKKNGRNQTRIGLDA
ncbi:diguanylate cyclase [Paenibacillus sp. M1]|uniref:Diguanylate cyclase n=1 Tax=Paenibacillus haidiansis TaxID=1574488 RepID=A0ABU7VMW0_9BACL